MPDTTATDGISLEELLSEQPESDDPGYLAWKRRKIAAAVEHADEYPDDFLTQKEMWEKHGLDY